MIPILYEKSETQFTGNGLARLRDCISCVVTEGRNDVYECDFEYPVSGDNYDLIQCGRIIAVTHDESDDIQPFDIVSFSRPIDGIVSFHAVHISYRQSKMTVSGTEISSLADALALLTTAEPSNPFSYWTDKASTNLFAAADGVPRSVKQMLGGIEGSILDSYGGEYEWDKWTVKLWSARGRARDFTIRYGLNLMNYDEEVDYSDTYTSCIPFWVGSNDDGDVVVKGSKVSSGIVPYDGREACIPLDLTQKFSEQPTQSQLEETAAELMKSDKVYVPSQTIKVEFVRLQDGPEYENYASLMECSLCDSVNVMFPNYDVSGSFKIVKTTYNVLNDRFDEMELGTLSITLQSAIDTSGTSPSVTEVRTMQTAVDAQVSAESALASAESAYASAQSAQSSADAAASAAQSAVTDAQEAKSAATAASTAASAAQTSAGNALTAAQNAQSSADAALVSLSNVEDVVGVLEWITAHGTMTANGSTALDPSKVYFIADPNGDYVVGGTHYSIVSEPKAEERTSYYILSVDESVQNYIATHVVVDAEGLWLIPDSGGNKVLIATGSGSTYTTAGTYIIGKVNGVDTVFAKFTTTGVTMNATNSTQIAHLGYGSGNAESGTADAPYYTLGVRFSGSAVGNYSTAEGFNTIASGYCSHAEGAPFGSPTDGPRATSQGSHAEGRGTESTGLGSHAEGGGSVASGNYSHAQNLRTIAQGADQTTLGKYNVADTASAVIIGNGTANNARSNALTIDWNGDVNLVGQAKTSFKSSIAMGSYQATATTVDGLANEVRFSSGCVGSANITTAYTKDNITVSARWYNFFYIPHRSGGVNGSASGDNCNYGHLMLLGMTGSTTDIYDVWLNGNNGAISKLSKYYTSADRYTRSNAGTLDWSNQTDGDAKVIMKSALAFWNGAYNGTGSNLRYSANGEIVGTSTGLGKTTWTPTSGSSYSNYGGCYYEKYGRVVHVHVGVSGLTANTATNIYTLPSGYRPSSPIYAHGTGGSWNNIGYVEIGTGGVVTVRSQGAYCGADVTFLA